MAQLTIPLDAKRFATGMTWKDYMAQIGERREMTEKNYQKATLTDDERKFFSGITQARHALMLAENWCGDVHRNSPVLARICEAMPNCELRVLFRDQNLDLTDCFLNNGYRSIPVLVFFDKDWNELVRWIERPHAATQRMFGIRARTTEVAGPDKDKQDVALNEFRSQFLAAYDTAPDKSLWRDAVKEVRLLLETRLGLTPKQ
jgi:Thioredoxin